MPSPKRVPAWRADFLRALSLNGNVTFAATKAGVNPSSAFNMRRRNPDFAQAWAEALATGQGRIAAGLTPARPKRPPAEPDLDDQVVQRTASGIKALVRAGPGRWSIGIERRFLATLADTACVRRACEAIEMSAVAVYARRKRDPDLAARWAEALRLGEARIPDLLTASVLAAFDPAAAGAGVPAATVAETIAIARLKGLGRSGGAAPGAPDAEAARASILGKIDAIERAAGRG